MQRSNLQWEGNYRMPTIVSFPGQLPAAGREYMERLEADLIDEDEVPAAWLTTLADAPNRGPVRPVVERLPELVLH